MLVDDPWGLVQFELAGDQLLALVRGAALQVHTLHSPTCSQDSEGGADDAATPTAAPLRPATPPPRAAQSARACPSCGAPLSLKFSSKHRGVPFVGCSAYPECEYSRPIAPDWLDDADPPAGAAAATAGEGPGGAAAPAAATAAAAAAAGECAEGLLDAEEAAALHQMGIKGAPRAVLLLPRLRSPRCACPRCACTCLPGKAPRGARRLASPRAERRPAAVPGAIQPPPRLVRAAGFARFLGRCPQTELPVFVRSGLYGPYVQRGLEGADELFKRQPLARVGRTACCVAAAPGQAGGLEGTDEPSKRQPLAPASGARRGGVGAREGLGRAVECSARDGGCLLALRRRRGLAAASVRAPRSATSAPPAADAPLACPRPCSPAARSRTTPRRRRWSWRWPGWSCRASWASTRSRVHARRAACTNGGLGCARRRCMWHALRTRPPRGRPAGPDGTSPCLAPRAPRVPVPCPGPRPALVPAHTIPPLCDHPPAGEAVVVLMGKFGPFIRCGAASRSLPKVRCEGGWLPVGGGQLTGCALALCRRPCCDSKVPASGPRPAHGCMERVAQGR